MQLQYSVAWEQYLTQDVVDEMVSYLCYMQSQSESNSWVFPITVLSNNHHTILTQITGFPHSHSPIVLIPCTECSCYVLQKPIRLRLLQSSVEGRRNIHAETEGICTLTAMLLIVPSSYPILIRLILSLSAWCGRTPQQRVTSDL